MKNKICKRQNKFRKKHSFNGKIISIKTETFSNGRLKLILIGILMLAQLSLFIYFQTISVMGALELTIFSYVLSLITCVYVLSSNKNGLSKAVWIIFLLFCFSFAYIFFWISNEEVVLRRKKRLFEKAIEHFGEEKNPDFLTFNSVATKQTSSLLYKSGNFRSYNDNQGKYFPSGTQFFDDVIDRIKKAEKFIFMEFFIISNGVLFQRVMDILIEKAKCGVDCRIIYDDFGSHSSFSNKLKNKLKQSSIKIIPFNKMLPVFSIAVNYRDHRKIIIVDGKTAYTCGCNLADEYINERIMHGYWKDAGVRIDGSGVDSFSRIFLTQWEVLSKKQEDFSKFLNLYEEYKNNSIFIPYADGLFYQHPIARSVYENMIASSDKFLYIMTPYFIVDDVISNLLINKALSGVDVRIILPDIPDKAVVYTITRGNCEKLMEHGVKIYTMKNAFVHSKVLFTEDAVAVGSINMDLRSFYQQFECGLYTDDKQIYEGVKKDFEDTLQRAEQITEKNKWSKNIFYRMFVGAMQVFAPFM